jgi:hypothetical protein
MTFMDSSSLTFWEIISEVGFIMVIVGVVGEGIELVVEWLERHKPEGTQKKPQWLLPVATLSFVILVVGLAMEFLGSHNAMRIADSQNARLNKEAADARKDAGVAIESAAVVKKDAALANERAGIANKLAGQANERAGQADERAAIIEATNTALSVQAEALRSNNLELEAKALGLQQQLVQTSNNVVKISPINQPIKSMRADVHLVILGTNILDTTDWKSMPPKLASQLFSIINSQNAILIKGKDSTLASLGCVNHERQATFFPVRGTAYSMSFAWPSGDAYGSIEFSNTNSESWISRENASTAELDKTLTGLTVFLAGITSNSEIADGSCVLTINGSIQRRFLIPELLT